MRQSGAFEVGGLCLAAVGGLVLGAFAAGDAVESRLPSVSCPRAVERHEDRERVSELCRMTVSYPAQQVIASYESSLTEAGWIPTQRFGAPGWQEFVDQSGPETVEVRQRLRTWRDASKDIEALLVLRYVRTPGQPWSDELVVALQLHPLIGVTRWEAVFDDARAAGDVGELNRLLARYERAGADADLSRAVIENPSNGYLRRLEHLQRKLQRSDFRAWLRTHRPSD